MSRGDGKVKKDMGREALKKYNEKSNFKLWSGLEAYYQRQNGPKDQFSLASGYICI